jgi:hypothetical protein
MANHDEGIPTDREAVENAIDNSTGMAYEVMNLPPYVIGVQVSQGLK